ncbi:MAG: hypothetical protein JRJ77_03655 [Deltaproteobacteria bacterium]|nr:hypothetical protein [Deltaproteobacteria bacterium]MBW2340374.1 hypothetical protein [Deltaproteobacteria bacterium]
MKIMLGIISMAFALISCATSGTIPEQAQAPEPPSVDKAMVTITESLPTESHQRVAVFSFAERGFGRTLLGEYIAEKLMVALSATERVELVERNRLDAVSQEQKLGASGLIDDATAASIGNIAGAQAVLVGTLTRFGDCWELTARLLGSSDARVLAMAEGRFSAASVPPNLAGQPIASSSAPEPAQTKATQEKQPPAQAEQRPTHHPPQVQATHAQRQPPMQIVFKRCVKIRDPKAKKKCFKKLRALILSEPRTPRKVAATKCWQLPNPRQRIRCLRKVLEVTPR